MSSTFAETIGNFFNGVDKNVKQANILINGPRVKVKYEKSKNSVYEETFGEDEFNAFRTGLYYLLFVICFIILSIIFLYFLAPAFFTFQSKDVNIVLKIGILLASIISPLGLYPLLISFLGPYHIYSSFLTVYHTNIFYLFGTLISYKKLDITDPTNLIKTEINMGTIMGLIFMIGMLITVGNLTKNFISGFYPSVANYSSKTKKKDEIVSKKYYEENKDKDLY
jgi:hypothetical protein